MNPTETADAPSLQPIIDKVRAEARAFWPGDAGEGLADKLEAFLRRTAADYADRLGLTPEAVLAAIEARRNYSAANYYQPANFPPLADVRVFADQAEMLAACPSRRFRCPACRGISTDPYRCNSGDEMEPGKVCNWAAFGLFRTLGKGLRFTLREGFLDHPQVDEIFLPVELEAADEGKGGMS